MKSVLIVANNLEIGGAERALISLLNTFDCEKYNVDLFLLRHDGEFMNMIPSKINLLPEIKEYTSLGIPIMKALEKKLFKQVYGRVVGKIRAKKFIKMNNIRGVNSVEIEYSYKYTKKFMPKISDKKYDLAIGFSTPYYIVDEKVNASKKIAWIHTDYSKIPGDTQSELKMWSIYDNIVSISDAVTNSFISKYPSLENKIILIENIVLPELIYKEANLIDVSVEMKHYKNKINILSIGRFSPVKNFTSIPNICKLILEKGLDVNWYIIGYGEEESMIKEKIKELNLEENIFILGQKSNPYPYIKECDIYVQPSKFEGKSVTVREAQILGKPVVITDFPTAKDHIENLYDGIISPMDNESCAKEIINLIENDGMRELIIGNCKNTNYSNKDEIKKIYNLIGNR